MIRRLNIKLILLFFIAKWLFMKAGEILGYLENPTLAEQIRQTKSNSESFKNEGLTTISVTDLILTSGLTSLAGLLVSLIISLIICRKRKWHWLNPTLALLLVYITGWLQTGNLNFFGQLLWMPGETFNGVWYYLINGLVSIILGSLTFALITIVIRPPGNNQK